jgi:protein O-GlcNAc transferase
MLKRLFAEISGRLRRARAQSDTRNTDNPNRHPDSDDPGKSAFTAVLARQDNAIACNELGERRLADGARAEARACFERAVALDPGLVAARFNLGNLLFGANLIYEAAAQYAAILALQADNPDALNNLGMTFLQTGRPADAVHMFRDVLKMHPECDQARNNLLLALTLAPGHTPEEMLEEHLRHANQMRHARATHNSRHRNAPDSRRRLRIGYVSGDFKNHPVAWFMVRILAQHDADRLEIFCYSNV